MMTRAAESTAGMRARHGVESASDGRATPRLTTPSGRDVRAEHLTFTEAADPREGVVTPPTRGRFPTPGSLYFRDVARELSLPVNGATGFQYERRCAILLP
jgi:hypothetical protein